MYRVAVMDQMRDVVVHDLPRDACTEHFIILNQSF